MCNFTIVGLIVCQSDLPIGVLRPLSLIVSGLSAQWPSSKWLLAFVYWKVCVVLFVFICCIYQVIMFVKPNSDSCDSGGGRRHVVTSRSVPPILCPLDRYWHCDLSRSVPSRPCVVYNRYVQQQTAVLYPALNQKNLDIGSLTLNTIAVSKRSISTYSGQQISTCWEILWLSVGGWPQHIIITCHLRPGINIADQQSCGGGRHVSSS